MAQDSGALPGPTVNGEGKGRAGGPASETNTLSLWLNGIMLIIAAYLSVVSISEITARQEFCNILDSKVRLLADLLAKQPDTAVASTGSSNKTEEILKFAYIRDKLEALAVVGAGGRERTTRDLVNEFLDEENRLLGGAELRGSKPQTNLEASLSSNLLDMRLARLNSDYLLAIALVGSGLAGSLIRWLRQELQSRARKEKNNQKSKPDSYLDPSDMLLGLAAGFFTLLSIKGGKAIFIVDHRADLAAFNPYSSSLVALLAGLYSDKAFRLLSSVVGTFEERFKKEPKSVSEHPARNSHAGGAPSGT